MPRISEFFGISIHMYWREHGPPHFHAVYGEDQAAVSIDDLSVLHGALSPRVLGLVIEWATLHQSELAELWERAQRLEPLGTIDPLQ
jgi:hypothetical protein